MLVELAWRWLRFQPDLALSKWFQARFGNGGKRQRRVDIVARARRLAVAIQHCPDHGVGPEGAKLKSAAAGGNNTKCCVESYSTIKTRITNRLDE